VDFPLPEEELQESVACMKGFPKPDVPKRKKQ